MQERLQFLLFLQAAHSAPNLGVPATGHDMAGGDIIDFHEIIEIPLDSIAIPAHQFLATALSLEYQWNPLISQPSDSWPQPIRSCAHKLVGLE